MLIAYALTVKKNSVDAQFKSLEQTKGFMKYLAMLGQETAKVLPEQATHVSRVREKSVEARLRRAGNPWGITPTELRVLKIGTAVVGVLVGFMTYFYIKDTAYFIPWYVYAIITGLVGFKLPDVQLTKKEEARMLAFRKELPEALDLIIIANSVQSSIQSAIKTITPLLKDGVVKEEFSQVCKDLRSGRPLDQALSGMAERAPSAEVEGFVSTVIQATTNGQDVTDALRRRSAAMRAEYIALLDRKIASLSSRIMIYLSPTMIIGLMLVAVAPSLSSIVGSL